MQDLYLNLNGAHKGDCKKPGERLEKQLFCFINECAVEK